MSQARPRISRRRALEGAAVVVVVLGLLLWWILPLDEPSPTGRVVFSTGVKSGVYDRYGELLRDAADQDLPGLDLRLLPSEGSQTNVARVATGKADFTIAAADAVEKYNLDNAPGWERLRGCARLYDDYVQLVVRNGSKVRSAADLRGKRVAIGQEGSGVRLIAERVLKAAELDPETDIEAVPSGIDKAPQQLEDGEIEAFFWSGGLPTTIIKNLSLRTDIRLVELGDLVDALHKQGGASRYYRAAVIPPADAYPAAQHDSAVRTLAVANLLVTTDQADERLTEALTRMVIDRRDAIGDKVHAAQVVDLRTAIYTDPLKLHDGARDYYRSEKP